MLIEDISAELISELSLTDSVAFVSSVLRGKIGDLNNSAFSSLSINEDTGTADSVSPELKAILKLIYLVYYYSRLSRENLLSLGVSSVLSVEENGARVLLHNKNEISKTYLQLSRDAQNELTFMINAYRTSNTSPKSVDGADTINGGFEGLNYNSRVYPNT